MKKWPFLAGVLVLAVMAAGCTDTAAINAATTKAEGDANQANASATAAEQSAQSAQAAAQKADQESQEAQDSVRRANDAVARLEAAFSTSVTK